MLEENVLKVTKRYQRLQVGNVCFFLLREDRREKVVGIHDFGARLIFLFEGRHRHGRQKFKQFDDIVGSASLERFDFIYTLFNADAWLEHSTYQDTPPKLLVGSMTVHSPAISSSIALPNLAEILAGEVNEDMWKQLEINTVKMAVR